MNGDGRCALIGQNRIVYHTNKPLLSYKSNELHVHLPDYVIVMLSYGYMCSAILRNLLNKHTNSLYILGELETSL